MNVLSTKGDLSSWISSHCVSQPSRHTAPRQSLQIYVNQKGKSTDLHSGDAVERMRKGACLMIL